MKNLIKKILKEELSDDELKWIREVDPIAEFGRYIDEQSSRYGFKDDSDRDWLRLIDNTKEFLEEFVDETNILQNYVESLKSSTMGYPVSKATDTLKAIEEMLGDEDGQSSWDYVEYFHDNQHYLWTFLNNFGHYANKQNLTLVEMLNLSHTYFDQKVDDDIKRSDDDLTDTEEDTRMPDMDVTPDIDFDFDDGLVEYNDYEKRSTTEMTMGLLLKAVDSLKDALRYVESALQFAHQTNNEDLIRELEDIRMHISHDDGDQIGWEGDHTHANIIGKIKDVIEKYS